MTQSAIPTSAPATSRAERETISARDRRNIKESDVCYYCSALWASEVDHIIPVTQGGTSDLSNLAHACRRCNAEKSGRTPAQWRTSREGQGKSWPPPDIQFVLADIVKEFELDLIVRFRRAFVSGYRPLRDAVSEVHDLYYDESPPPVAQTVARLTELTAAYEAQVSA